MRTLSLVLLIAAVANASILHETFSEGWDKRWIHSSKILPPSWCQAQMNILTCIMFQLYLLHCILHIFMRLVVSTTSQEADLVVEPSSDLYAAAPKYTGKFVAENPTKQFDDPALKVRPQCPGPCLIFLLD